MLGAATVAVWIAVAIWHPAEALRADPRRFVEVATTPGIPYRNFSVEYAPLETVIVRVIGPTSASSAAVMTLIANAVSTIVVVWLLARRWGDRVAGTFLLLGLPLQVFMPFRLDALSVTLAVAGLATADIGRERAAGVFSALAVLFKVWPVVLLPIFWLRRQRRALATALLVLVVGVGVWVAVGGPSAITQVSGSRGATGWHVESTVGVLVAIVTGGPLRGGQGAVRVGLMTWPELVVLRAVTLTVLTFVWRAARERTDVQPSGMPAAAAVGALLALSPLFSAQYVSWLLPWAAIAVEERPRRIVAVSSLAASCFAAAIFVVYWMTIRPTALVTLALGRVMAVSVIVGAWLAEARSLPSGETAVGVLAQPHD